MFVSLRVYIKVVSYLNKIILGSLLNQETSWIRVFICHRFNKKTSNDNLKSCNQKYFCLILY